MGARAGRGGNGKVCREFVEFVDLVPTVGELAGLDLPTNLEGISFAPLLANPDQPWKKAVFMVENESSQVVRNRKYSYLEFKKGPVPAALYDLEKDPWETVNLADDPAYAKARQEMADSQGGLEGRAAPAGGKQILGATMMTNELNRRTMLGMLAAGSAAWAMKPSAAAEPEGSAGKILMPIGDATEAVDTLYPSSACRRTVIKRWWPVRKPACITWSCMKCRPILPCRGISPRNGPAITSKPTWPSAT